jgi:hypothetical protein
MNIHYAIKQKGRIILLLIVLGALKLANGNAYNRSIADMGDSVSEVYADRLVAQDYIYKLSAKIHERKLALQEGMSTGSGSVVLPEAQSLSILALLRDYEKTKFTADEKIVYDEFRGNLVNMIALQQRYALTNPEPARQGILQSYRASLDLSLKQLERLSGIQMQRGEDIHADSQKIVSFSSILHQLDWALIVITLMIIMALIFASRPRVPWPLMP